MDIRLVSEDDKVYANIYLDDKLSGISKITSSDGQTQTLPQEVNNKRILYIHRTSSFDQMTSSKYKDITYTTTYPSINDIEEYDIVIIDSAYGAVDYNNANEYFIAGMNLITTGNDTESGLKIIKDTTISNLITGINSSMDSIITRRLNNIVNESNYDSQYLIHFADGVETWYRGYDANGNLYDAIGMYEENNTQWVHSQFQIYYLGVMEHLLDYIFKENGARFELTKGKQYTIYGYDVAGNIIEKTLYVE